MAQYIKINYINVPDPDNPPVGAEPLNATNSNHTQQGIYDNSTHTESPHAPLDADKTSDNETSHADVIVDGDFASNGVMNRTNVGAYSILALGVDIQAYDINTTKNNANNTFTKAQRGLITTLTYSTAVAIDFDANNRYKLTLTADLATMSAPTNVTAGQGGVIYVTQDGTGGWNLAKTDWNTVYKFLDDYTLDETAGATNVFAYEVLDSSNIVMSYLGSF